MKVSNPKSSFKFRGDERFRFQSVVIPFITIALSLVWLIAVFKVFVLENRKTVNINHGWQDSQSQIVIVNGDSKASESKASVSQIHLKAHPHALQHSDKIVHQEKSHELPASGDWLFIRSSPNYHADHGKIVLNKGNKKAIVSKDSERAELQPLDKISEVQPKAATDPLVLNSLKSNYDLRWPPVQADGSIPLEEGTDSMPLTNLKVPRFWAPNPGEDMNKVGSKVNGEETIFLMIASYRDFQCRETITSAFSRSDHPERLFVGAVDQVVPGDTGCLDIDIPCEQKPDQPICKYRNQISVFKMDAQFATGPVTARHIGDRMYRGEYFVMQMDAHCLFVNHWDSQLIKQWKSTNNEMAVLRLALHKSTV